MEKHYPILIGSRALNHYIPKCREDIFKADIDLIVSKGFIDMFRFMRFKPYSKWCEKYYTKYNDVVIEADAYELPYYRFLIENKFFFMVDFNYAIKNIPLNLYLPSIETLYIIKRSHVNYMGKSAIKTYKDLVLMQDYIYERGTQWKLELPEYKKLSRLLPFNGRPDKIKLSKSNYKFFKYRMIGKIAKNGLKSGNLYIKIFLDKYVILEIMYMMNGLKIMLRWIQKLLLHINL